MNARFAGNEEVATKAEHVTDDEIAEGGKENGENERGRHGGLFCGIGRDQG